MAPICVPRWFTDPYERHCPNIIMRKLKNAVYCWNVDGHLTLASAAMLALSWRARLEPQHPDRCGPCRPAPTLRAAPMPRFSTRREGIFRPILSRVVHWRASAVCENPDLGDGWYGSIVSRWEGNNTDVSVGSLFDGPTRKISMSLVPGPIQGSSSPAIKWILFFLSKNPRISTPREESRERTTMIPSQTTIKISGAVHPVAPAWLPLRDEEPSSVWEPLGRIFDAYGCALACGAFSRCVLRYLAEIEQQDLAVVSRSHGLDPGGRLAELRAEGIVEAVWNFWPGHRPAVRRRARRRKRRSWRQPGPCIQ